MEQYTVAGKLSRSFIVENLSLVGEGFLSVFTEALVSHDQDAVIAHLEDLKNRSIEPRRFFDEYLYYLRDQLFEKLSDPSFPRIMEIFRAFEETYPKLRDFPDPFLLLEIAVLSLIRSEERASVPSKNPPRTEPKKAEPVKIQEEIAVTPPPEEIRPTESIRAEAPPAKEEMTERLPDQFSLTKLVAHLKGVAGRGVLVTALKNGVYRIEGNTFVLGCSSEFERKKLATSENENFLSDCIKELFSTIFVVSFEVAKTKRPMLATSEISDIF